MCNLKWQIYDKLIAVIEVPVAQQTPMYQCYKLCTNFRLHSLTHTHTYSYRYSTIRMWKIILFKNSKHNCNSFKNCYYKCQINIYGSLVQEPDCHFQYTRNWQMNMLIEIRFAFIYEIFHFIFVNISYVDLWWQHKSICLGNQYVHRRTHTQTYSHILGRTACRVQRSLEFIFLSTHRFYCRPMYYICVYGI